LDIIGRGETFSDHGFRVSGFRPALSFSLLTPDTSVPVSNFHAIPRQLKSHSYFSKLNDEVCPSGLDAIDRIGPQGNFLAEYHWINEIPMRKEVVDHDGLNETANII